MASLEYLDEEGTVNFLFVPWKLLNNWLSELNGNPHVHELRDGVNRGKVIEELQNRKHQSSTFMEVVFSRGYGKDWLEYENEQGYTHFEELLIYQPKDWRKQAREYLFRYSCNLERESPSEVEDVRRVRVTLAVHNRQQTIDIVMSKPSLVVLFHPEMKNSRRHEPLNFLLAYGVKDPIPSLPGLEDATISALLREISPLDYYFFFKENVQSYGLATLRGISRQVKHPRLTLIKELDFMKVVGQRMAKHIIRQEVVNHLWKRVEEGTMCPQRQPLSMIFAGPSGNGKTEMARELAELMNAPDKNAFLKVDCGKLQHSTEIFGLSGAYQGAQEGSALNNFVLRMASEPDMLGIVLLDEIEKAHQDVIHGLYQVFDKGEWTNKKLERGRSQTITIPCHNLIFIMTTNAADLHVCDYAAEKQVHSLVADDLEDTTYDVERRIRTVLQHRYPFTGAFIGRISRVVPFFPMASGDLDEGLLQGEMMVIAKLFIEREQERLNMNGMFMVDQSVSAKEKHKMARMIVAQSNPESGVRSIQNGIEAHMGKKMRHLLLVEKGGIRSGAEVRYWANESEKKIGFNIDKSGTKKSLKAEDDEEDASLFE